MVRNLANCELLDLACGDGLLGAALHARRVFNVTGMDSNFDMMSRAVRRGVYIKTVQADLLARLPSADNFWDIVICLSATAFLTPSVLSEWLRVVKPGGLVVFSHPTAIAVTRGWEAEQDGMARRGEWSEEWASQEVLDYLP